jgi:hypothetical protein
MGLHDLLMENFTYVDVVRTTQETRLWATTAFLFYM